MDSNGVRILVDLLTLAHLHTNRATVPLQVLPKHTAAERERSVLYTGGIFQFYCICDQINTALSRRGVF